MRNRVTSQSTNQLTLSTRQKERLFNLSLNQPIVCYGYCKFAMQCHLVSIASKQSALPSVSFHNYVTACCIDG